MATFSSYDDLIKHVEGLKSENTQLREELDHNSSHLSKLESNASSMKDVLAHLQKSMQEDLENRGEGVASNMIQQPIPDQNSNNTAFNEHFHNNRGTWTPYQAVKSKSCETQSPNFLTEYKPSYEVIQTMLQDLNNERLKILNDVENEEKERMWFENQMKRIKQQQHSIPLSNNYSTENEEASHELEQEACQLLDTMHQKFGSKNEMLQRYQIRMQSLQLIDKEVHKLQEQTQKYFAKSNISDNNDCDNCEANESRENCASPVGTKSSKMTTSATQTTIDLYPSDCPTSNSHPGANSDNNEPPVYHGTWPLDKVALWHSGPSSIGEMNSSLLGLANQETSSIMSFTSSMNSSSSRRIQLGTKVEVVYSLLSLLGSHDKDEMSKSLLAMSSSSAESCVAMRQSGCMPLLIQLLYGSDKDSGSSDLCSNREVRLRASKAIHNIVHAHPDDKRGRREARVLRLLEQIRDYCDSLHDAAELGSDEERNASGINNMEQHPGPAMAALMKLSFDEEHRHAMCQLGGLQAIAELVEVDYAVHGNTSDQYCVTSRRYASMALTNLTFGDGTNKALLCSIKSFMRALVAQLHSPSEDLRQVVASVLRNLSWRADPASKKILREVDAVSTLMKAAMEAKKESTLKSVLSALWNLSAHCSINKADICAVDGALAFLVSTLTYKSTSKTLAIIENGGGILRNISSQIAVHEEYRALLRLHNCLQILLQHLRSSSLTIVSNACGTLWNLSARCSEDQQTLWEMGAVSMLRNLVHSKHKMISMGSSAALKNLLAAKPQGMALAAPGSVDGQRNSAPSLLVRKQKALEAEIDQNLAETCDNIDSPKSSPTHRIDSRYVLAETNGHNPLFDRVFPTSRLYNSTDGSSLKYSCEDADFLMHKLAEEDLECNGCQPETSDGFYNNLGKAGLTTQESSRIAQVMQEVVRQVALEDSLVSSTERKFTYSNGDKNLLAANSLVPQHLMCDVNSFSEPSNIRSPTIYDKYSDFKSKIDTRNANEFVGHEKHEKCNSKYSDNKNGAMEGIIPKVNNYSGGDRRDKLQMDKVKQESAAIKQHPKQTNIQWQGINGGANYNANKMFTNPDEKKIKPIFPSYDETDLEAVDQPTNYSLRYTEDNDTMDKFSAPAPKAVYYPSSFDEKKPSVHDDTLTTYCTEGTPLNYSTATSMTDLRDVRDKGMMHQEGVAMNENVKSDCAYPNEIVTSDKPMSYCVEGTPVRFSHMSSLSSLHSEDVQDRIKENLTANDDANDSNIKILEEEKDARNVMSENKTDAKEGKSVSFGEDNVAEETPLMFSRCSSLGSLSSFEQHSIHDDRSSVVSDFSRRASGAVSPSDLPDSPSQTMPCSPKRVKANVDFTTKLDEKQESNYPFANDATVTYETENTPFNFSSATSLSSLVIYDDAASTHDADVEQKQNRKNSHAVTGMNERTDADESQETELLDADEKGSSDIEENDEALLAAVINSGMPPNNAAHSSHKHNNSKLSSKVNKLNGPPRTRTSGIPIKAVNVRVMRPPQNAAAANLPLPPSSTTSTLVSSAKQINEIKDQFSAKGKKSADYYGPNIDNDRSTADDDLLAECIQSGMPKSKLHKRSKIPPVRPVADGASAPDLPERASRKQQHLCQTPKSKPPSAVKNQFVSCWNDEVRVYAVEGTPSNISGFSSLSDLTVDPTDVTKMRKIARDGPSGSSSQAQTEYLESLCAPDSYTSFAEEGTPVVFSRQDSLSSLSVLDDELGNEKERRRMHKDNMLYRISGKYNTSGSPSRNRSRSSSVDVSSSNYKTPSTNQMNLTTTIMAPSKTESVDEEIKRPEFMVEDTPMCFSRNSSLSSLSVESLSLEQSAAEQALLDECINSGMPKSNNGSHREKKKRKSGQGKSKENGEKMGKITDPNGNRASEAENKSGVSESSQEVISRAEERQGGGEGEELDKRIPITDEVAREKSPDREKLDNLTDSKILQIEADHLAQDLTQQAATMVDSTIQSPNNDYSDLENVKPPSVLGDVLSLNCSMVSSWASDSVGERRMSTDADANAKNRRLAEALVQACKRSGATIPWNLESNKLKNVPELVLRALSTNPDALKVNPENAENASMRSSCASELLDNVKPPSVFEEIDLTSSTYSVASITSEVAEVRSEAPSMKGSFNSEALFECIKPVVAMAEFYAREGALFGSMKSSCTSEIIENVNPPSILQDVTECNSTNNDVTATLGSDTDTDDELPEDVDATIVPHEMKKTRVKAVEESSPRSNDSSFEITPEVVQALQENANLVVSTLIEFKQNAYNDDSSLNEDVFIECETLSLVSNESESSRTESENSNAEIISMRPRIVNPNNRDRFRSASFQANEEKSPKGIRGKRRSVTKPRQKPSSIPPPRCESPRAKDASVKSTRTSALRATQSQQKIVVPSAKSGIAVPKTMVSKIATKTVKSVESKVPTPTKANNVENETEENKPKPPVKQGTFTKDKPSQPTTPKISPTKIKPPSTNTKLSNGENGTPVRSRMLQSRSLDDRTTPASNSPHSRLYAFADAQSKYNGRRVQSPSPMNRKVSNSLNNLKKGTTSSVMKSSPSNQSVSGINQSGRRTPNGGSRSRSGSLTSGLKSTSNQSLSSNNSSNTSVTKKKVNVTSNLVKRQAVSKVAAVWKKNSDEEKTSGGKGLIKRPTGLPRSSTYEKIPRSESMESEKQTAGIRLEDKNQANNKTFTKSPSVDSKLGSIIGSYNKDIEVSDLPTEDTSDTVKTDSTRPVRPKTLLPFGVGEGEYKKPEQRTATAAAIVAPFNYNPSLARGVGQVKSLIPTPTKMAVAPFKHRDSYTSEQRSEETSQAPPKTNTCLITTV